MSCLKGVHFLVVQKLNQQNVCGRATKILLREKGGLKQQVKKHFLKFTQLGSILRKVVQPVRIANGVLGTMSPPSIYNFSIFFGKKIAILMHVELNFVSFLVHLKHVNSKKLKAR